MYKLICYMFKQHENLTVCCPCDEALASSGPVPLFVIVRAPLCLSLSNQQCRFI